MFGKAYIVDIIADGEQIFDSGIIPTQEIAGTAFDLIVSGDMPGIDYPTGTEYTVREIVNGEILAEATILNGKVLDSISHR